jgi:hypothetical protein
MPTLFDFERGEPTEVAEADVGQALATGRFGLPKGQDLPVIAPDGTPGTIPAAQAASALQAGYVYETEGARHERKLQQEYGEGTGTEVRAFAEGAARGATFGLSDVALTGLGADAEGLRERQARNTKAALGGEVVGAAAGVLLPGGPAAMAFKGGQAASRIAARAVGKTALASEGAGLAARVLAKGIPAGVGSAVEGAAYGLGQSVSEDALGKAELTAERVMANVGLGALLGAGGGALFAGGGEVARMATRKLADTAEGALTKLFGTEALKGIAEERAFKASGAMLKDYRLAGKKGEEEIRRIGRDLLDDGVVTASSTLDDIASKANTKATEYGERIGTMIKELDTLASKERPDFLKVIARARKEVIEPLAANPSTRHIAEAVENRIRPFEETAMGRSVFRRGSKQAESRMGFERTWQIRKALDKQLKYDKVALPAETEQLRKFRGILEEEFEQAAERASQKVGKGFRDEYALVKRKYASMATARDIAEDRLGRQAANRTISLSDYVSGGAGTVAGTVAGSVLTGGGLTAGALTGAATAGLNKTMRERGSAFLAGTLDKVTRLSKIERTANATLRKTDTAIGRFVERLQAGARVAASSTRRASVPTGLALFDDGTPAKREGTEPKYAAFRRQLTALNDLATNPDLATERVSQKLAEAHEAAPKMTAALTARAMTALQFLHEKAPKDPHASSALPNLGPEWKPSAGEMARFQRYARAVEDPTSVMDDLEAGKVSMEAVEALKAVYPELHQELGNQILEQVALSKQPLPYRARVQLSLLFDLELDPTLNVEFVRAMQGHYGQAREDKEPSGGMVAPTARGLGRVDVAGGLRTATESIASR